ncbi:large ribosomal subunit protein mL49 isoform X2 [Molothrus aeneus]|uniref:large ribosomal subunit protein mL49 isoform X2 n=1 Tax=Molothrus aeneus TaxID=84833 RepID=UPI0023EE1606|nr:39S ribosomal protein L49, mitochondrial isoform X2 [Agelaius phoeniceus]
MAAMAALGRRLRALGRGVRGVQTPPRYEESTAEFGFVERLLPPSRIPDPPPHPKYPTPSGWSPPADPPPDLPYFVRRSRLHNLPVYLGLRQGRRLTELRRIHGDIWGVPEVAAQVNEVTGTLRLRGHWGAQVRQWLLQRGF